MLLPILTYICLLLCMLQGMGYECKASKPIARRQQMKHVGLITGSFTAGQILRGFVAALRSQVLTLHCENER